MRASARSCAWSRRAQAWMRGVGFPDCGARRGRTRWQRAAAPAATQGFEPFKGVWSRKKSVCRGAQSMASSSKDALRRPRRSSAPAHRRRDDALQRAVARLYYVVEHVQRGVPALAVKQACVAPGEQPGAETDAAFGAEHGGRHQRRHARAFDRVEKLAEAAAARAGVSARAAARARRWRGLCTRRRRQWRLIITIETHTALSPRTTAGSPPNLQCGTAAMRSPWC